MPRLYRNIPSTIIWGHVIITNKRLYQNIRLVVILATLILSVAHLGLQPFGSAYATGPTYNFVKSIEHYQTPTDSMYYPSGIVRDSSGNLYVVDQHNNRVLKFDGSGGFITSFGEFGSLPGQFDLPNGIALDSSGNV